MRNSIRTCENSVAGRCYEIFSDRNCQKRTFDSRFSLVEQQNCLLSLRHVVFTQSAIISYGAGWPLPPIVAPANQLGSRIR